FHQTSRKMIPGRGTAAVFPQSAHKYNPSDSQQYFQGPNLSAAPQLMGLCLSSGSQNRKAAIMEPRKKTPETTFLRSVIQATDSTFMGCNAKSAAPSHAPGTRNRNRTRQSKSALRA